MICGVGASMVYCVCQHFHGGESAMAGEHEGHRRRMRERFMAQGLQGFAAHEILELILFYGIPRANVNPLAHRLLDTFGSLHAVLEADVKDLTKVEGIGESTAALLSLFGHVDRELEKSRSAARKKLKNRAAAQKHCLGLLAGLRQEHLYLVCMNAQLEVVQNALIAKGTLNEVQAHPRLVAEAALRANAHAVVLCHNHPGGSMIPSQADLDMTASLGKLLEGLDVTLIDHIIVAGDEALSMVECDLLQHETRGNIMTAKVADPGGELLIRNRVMEALKKKGNK